MSTERLSSLTARELEVLGLVAAGLSLAQIATNLNRSERTIKSHRQAIGRKLGATNRVELARIAIAAGIVAPPGTRGDEGHLRRRGALAWAAEHAETPLAVLDREARVLAAGRTFLTAMGVAPDTSRPDLLAALSDADRLALLGGVQTALRVGSVRLRLRLPTQQEPRELVLRSHEPSDSGQARLIASILPASSPASEPGVLEQVRVEQLLQSLNDAVSGTGPSCLPLLVRSLAQLLGTERAGVTRVQPGSTHGRMLAIWDGDGLGQPVDLDLALGPCGLLLNARTAEFPVGVHALFPMESTLVRSRTESYIGFQLVGSSGRVIGTACAWSSGRREWSPKDRAIGRLLAEFAAREMERQELAARAPAPTAV